MDDVHAVVIGSGPNGLVAAAPLARDGWRVTALERSERPGGAVHSGQLTVPGYVHDTYSAFYGLLHSSPVLRELGLDTGVPWAHFDVPVGVAASPDHVAVCHADLARTTEALDAVSPADADAWSALYRWWGTVGTAFLRQMPGPVGAARPAVAFGLRALRHGPFDTTSSCSAARRPRERAPRGPADRSSRPQGPRMPMSRSTPRAVFPPHSSWPWRPSRSACPFP